MGTEKRGNRTFRKLIRFRESEYARIAERARECGLTPARYIRETALGTAPKARHNHLEMEMIRELSRIGNTLNQLAQMAKRDGDNPREEELHQRLEEVLATIRRLGNR